MKMFDVFLGNRYLTTFMGETPEDAIKKTKQACSLGLVKGLAPFETYLIDGAKVQEVEIGTGIKK